MPKVKVVWLVGADSFTGRYVLPELRVAGYTVNTQWVDITDAQAVEKHMQKIQPEYIINLAGISFVPDGSNADIYAINTLGPQNILNASLTLNTLPKKIILASSSHVYGKQQQEVIDESCPVNPLSHYGCSKWAMEQIASTYQNKLNIIITRPFNYTGIGQLNKFLIPKIVSHFKAKEKVIRLGNIDVFRDFSDVRWIAKVYTKLLSEATNAISPINLCSNSVISIQEIIETLQSIAKHQIQIEVTPELFRSADMKKQWGSNKKLYTELYKLEQPIDIKGTLKWMLSE